jgi:hypothetical protein
MAGRETLITLLIPDDIAVHLAPYGDLSRTALEALALEAYREHKLSASQLRRLLGYRTRLAAHAFLKDHGVLLHYGPADLDHDRRAGDALSGLPA